MWNHVLVEHTLARKFGLRFICQLRNSKTFKNITRPLDFVYDRCVVLGMIICAIVTSFVPVDIDEFVRCGFPEPMIPHIPRFAALGAHRHANKGVSRFVVSLEPGW